MPFSHLLSKVGQLLFAGNYLEDDWPSKKTASKTLVSIKNCIHYPKVVGCASIRHLIF